MGQLAVRNRYSEGSRQLGSDIAGAVGGAYQGYQEGKERAEKKRLRDIQTASATLTLEEQMRKSDEAKTDRKKLKSYRMSPIRGTL